MAIPNPPGGREDVTMLSLMMAATLSLSGRCDYPASLRPPLVGEERALCDRVRVQDDVGATIIEFAHGGTTQRMRFSGEREGHRMIVRSAGSTRVPEKPAHGSCTIFYKEERVSAVSCVAQAGARSFVANFIVPAL
jgi:hypothetical protein